MASIDTLASGKWRVQIRCKGDDLSRSFSPRKDAEMWGAESSENSTWAGLFGME